MSKRRFIVSLSVGLRLALLAGILPAILAGSTGCGGGSSMTTLGTRQPATQVRISDAPADRVVTFEVNVGPITVTPSGGAAFTVLAGTQRVELSHLSGTSQPLVILDVPQGSYTTMSIILSNPEVAFINNLGAVVKLEPPLSQAVTINLSPAVTVGTAASVVSIDLNLANLLTFDSQGNVVGVTPSASAFSVSAVAVPAENNQEHAENGELEDITGTVTSISGTSFTMTVGQSGVPLTFTTDGNTEFKDGASLSTLMNTIVKVEGLTKPDNTLYAKEVEGVEDNNGMESDGLVTQVVGNPATQLNIVAQDGSGSGMDDTKVGSTLVVAVTGAQYKVSQGNIDSSGIGGLPSSPNFPFDATTVHAGQRVEVESASMINGTAIVAEKVKLQQQALTGTVSGLSGPTSAGPVTFTLTVASDSAFAMLSGQTTVTVFWQPGTDLHNLTNVNNSDQVRVRGLVFFTGSSFNLIARRIDH